MLPTKLTFGESQKKRSRRISAQQIFRMFFRDKSYDKAVFPKFAQMIVAQFHNGKQPFPECEIAMWQGFLAKLRPRYQLFIGIKTDVTSKGNLT